MLPIPTFIITHWPTIAYGCCSTHHHSSLDNVSSNQEKWNDVIINWSEEGLLCQQSLLEHQFLQKFPRQ